MMNDAERSFTLEEANAVVRMIRPLMEEILEIRRTIVERQPQLWPVVEKAAGNGGSRAATEVVQDFDRLDRLVREIRATGAIVKDINAGLVDFPAQHQGRLVYLCWRFGEEQIDFWHDLDSGFSGRQRLE